MTSRKFLLGVPILGKTWQEYYNCIKAKDRYWKTRLKVTQSVRKLFNKHVHFYDMNYIERRKIAGLIKESEYLWFGSMIGAGKFWQAVKWNNKHLSQALDLIPDSGGISRDMYIKYIEEYRKAFPKGRDGIATATRLLTMKRPDIFVCLNKQNLELCKDFGTSISITYELYWDLIIEPIMKSTWWNAPCPNSPTELEVWQARAAFLDSIYYVRK